VVYLVQTLNTAGAGANTTALDVDDGALTGTACNRVVILGAESPETISGNKIVTIPNDIENWYLVKNSTSGSNTVQFKYATGTGSSVTWAVADKGWKIIYATKNDGTNPDLAEATLGGLPGGSDTQVQFNVFRIFWWRCKLSLERINRIEHWNFERTKTTGRLRSRVCRYESI